MRHFAALCAVIAFLGVPLWAHVGSPDVYFQGVAGPYHLIITVRTPQMIPGIADVEILSATPGISKITVVPTYIVGPGAKYPPIGDALIQSKDDPQSFSGKVWLMESGSWQIRVQVDGAQGSGELSLPVPAAARSTLPMQKSLGVLLFALMVLLVSAIIAIAGAARREGMLEPGHEPGPEHVRRGRWVMMGAAVVVLALLLFGNWWWNSEAFAKARQMIYKAPPLNVSLDPSGKLILQMGDSAWHRTRPETVMTNLIPDHGHLMHLFLIREPGMDRFYHLHPELQPGVRPVGTNTFALDLPEMPAGRYQVFADVVRESGFPDTMTAEIDLPDVPGVPLTDDNSEAAGPPLVTQTDGGTSAGTGASGADGPVMLLPDKYRMVWERGTAPLVANHFIWLRFRLETPSGKAVMDMEQYMGMAGHAEIVRSDRSVFAHIHPDGSVAMAALELTQRNASAREAGSATDLGMNMDMRMEPAAAEVSFPYGFPKAGEYRIFVQMKRGGQVETGVFDTEVIQ
ncbi:MAG: hypothetical protein WA197_13210 [Candidatus Acidiferrales bacterium]